MGGGHTFLAKCMAGPGQGLSLRDAWVEAGGHQGVGVYGGVILFWPSAWKGQVKDSAYEMHGLKPGATKVWECMCGGGHTSLA